jgi:cation:H+ antiporter
MFQYILFVIGFTLLIEGANLLVEGASSVGRKLNVSDLVIGLTVVAFGTSLPELFVNIFASVRGDTDIAIGNVLGSNIANILLILGVSALISPLAVGKGTVWKEIPLSLLAALLLGIMANDHLIDGSSTSALTRSDGLVLLAFFVIFLYYSFGIARRIDGLDKHLPQKQHGFLKSFLLIAAGLAGLGVGANWIVGAAVQIASRIGVSQSFIGLTIVAVGTSLPELATSAVAAYRKNAEIAVGNIIGSNIFNIFFILGLSAVIKPLPFSPGSNIDIGVVILASLLLFVWMFTGKKRSLDRWEGMIFLILYGIYITFLVLKS